MKYVICWKNEYSCGIVKKDGKIASFMKPEKALKFAIECAEKWRTQNRKRNNIKISYREPNEYARGMVSAFDTDDTHCPADNWIQYVIDSGK